MPLQEFIGVESYFSFSILFSFLSIEISIELRPLREENNENENNENNENIENNENEPQLTVTNRNSNM